MAVWVKHDNTGTQDGTTRATGWDSINDAIDNIGGDTEIRCADAGDHTVLDGTLAWVDGATTITTSVDLTGSLAAEDFIAKSDFQSVDGESIWEISSLTSSVITLVAAYVGDTETIGSNLKITTFDDPALEVIDVSSLEITGGWKVADTTDPTGITFLRKTGESAGNGFTIDRAGSNIIENFGILRYVHNLFFEGGYGSSTKFNELDNIYCVGASTRNIYGNARAFGNILKNIYATGGGNYGLYESSCWRNEYDNLYVYSNAGTGIYSPNVIIGNVSSKRNATGLYFREGCFANLYNVELANNSLGIRVQEAYQCLVNINNLITSGNSTEMTIESNYYSETSLLNIQNYNGAGVNQQIFEYGVVSRDTDEARSTQCVQFTPTDATYTIITDLADIPVDSGVGITVGIYMKDDADFDGVVELSLWYMGQIIEDWTAKTMTTSYAQSTISCTNGDITEDGVVTLKCRVNGTDGNVYADDVSVS